jgi:hypothetical protein
MEDVNMGEFVCNLRQEDMANTNTFPLLGLWIENISKNKAYLIH